MAGKQTVITWTHW